VSPQQMLRQAIGAPPEVEVFEQQPALASPTRISISTSSQLLAHVKKTQADAQANRTAERARELMRDGTPSTGRKVKLAEFNTKNGSQQGVLEDPNHIPMFTGSPLRSAMFDPPAVRVAPATEARRNITQRRSRDRARETGDSSPKPEVVSRRPRCRSKDRRYSLESEGYEEDCERHDWRATSARSHLRQQPAPAPAPCTAHLSRYWVGVSEDRQYISKDEGDRESVQEEDLGINSNLAYRVPSSTGFDDNVSGSSSEILFPAVDPNTPFLREYIPSEETHPVLNRHLTNLWYERQDAVRGMGDALAEDNSVQYCAFQHKAESLNNAMHEEFRTCQIVDPILRRALAASPSQSNRSSDTNSTQSSRSLGKTRSSQSSHSSGKKYWPIDQLPLKEKIKKASRQTSWKEASTDAFEIKLSYQGVEVERTVHDHMQMRVLFTLAKGYLQADFQFKINDIKDIDLIYDGQILKLEGNLAEIPVLEGTAVYIEYPRRVNPNTHNQQPFVVRNQGLANQSQSKEGSTVQGPATVQHLADQNEFSSPASPSLDPRSYDKIRQSFKCPRFSGLAKDRKMWDKGFKRYLSIWELDYVLDPSFFDRLPLSSAQRRDNLIHHSSTDCHCRLHNAGIIN
jgi:hypothetical protein